MDSILNSVKKVLGLTADYTAFDVDIIMHINSVFTVLAQLGVGPAKPFSIIDASATWSDFFGEKEPIELAKSYMYLKVRLLFDPPNVGVLHEAMERQISEFEWRLNVEAETPAERSVIEDEADELDDADKRLEEYLYYGTR